MHYRIFSNILNLYPLEAGSLLPSTVMTMIRVSRHGQVSSGGQNFSWLRTIALELSESGKIEKFVYCKIDLQELAQSCAIYSKDTPFKMSWYMVLDDPSEGKEFGHKTLTNHAAKTSPVSCVCQIHKIIGYI